MTDYTRFEQHLDMIRKTVYQEPKFDYHERLIDTAFDAFVKKGSFGNVLDVGLGTGYSLEQFKKLNIIPTGISLDAGEVKGTSSLGYDVRIMDMAFLDFDDQSFDLIWCRHALEHSAMPMIALLEFNRVLKDGGFLYVEVPQDESVHVDNENHYSILSDRSWQALMRKAGLKLLYRGQWIIHLEGWVDIYWTYWLEKGTG